MDNEKGNALFLVLIAVVLFAALSYAVTQSGRSNGDASKEQRVLTASKMVDYTATLQQTVMRMTLMGVTPASLDFTHNGTQSGESAVFATDGGNMYYESTPDEIWSSTTSGWEFKTTVSVIDVGSPANDVFLSTGNGFANACIKKNVCEQINTGLGLSISPIGNQSAIFGDLDAYPGEHMACHNVINSGCNYYYHVLVAQ